MLAALSPMPAITYLWHAGPLAFVVIGGAFLAVTGGEAFYADMGHFGPLPIRAAWFGLALPALTLELLRPGRAAAHPSPATWTVRSTNSLPSGPTTAWSRSRRSRR